MIDLYYWTTPNGHKITIFLEETGLAYDIKPIDIAGRDLRRIGRIVDADGVPVIEQLGDERHRRPEDERPRHRCRRR